MLPLTGNKKENEKKEKRKVVKKQQKDILKHKHLNPPIFSLLKFKHEKCSGLCNLLAFFSGVRDFVKSSLA